MVLSAYDAQQINERRYSVRSICWLGFLVSGKDEMSQTFRIIGQHEYNRLESLRKLAAARQESGLKEFQMIMPKQRIKGFPYSERIAEYEEGKWSYAVNCAKFIEWSEKRMAQAGHFKPNATHDGRRILRTVDGIVGTGGQDAN